MELFKDFVAGLPANFYCVPCLAKLYNKPIESIQDGMRGLADVADFRMEECSLCNERTMAYRLGKP